MTAPMSAPPMPAPAPGPAAPPVDAAEAAKRADAVSMALHGTLGPEQAPAAPGAPQTPQQAAVGQALGRGAQIGATAPVQQYAATQAQQPYTWANQQRAADNAGTQSLLGAINTSTDAYLKNIQAAAPMDANRTSALVKQAELDFQDKQEQRALSKKQLLVANKQADADLLKLGAAAGTTPVTVDIAAKTAGVKPDVLKQQMGSQMYGSVLDQAIRFADKGMSQAEFNAWIDENVVGVDYTLLDENGKPTIVDDNGKPITVPGMPKEMGDFLKIRYGPIMSQYNAGGTGVVPASARPPVAGPPSTKSTLSKPQQTTLINAARAGVVLPPQVFQDPEAERRVAAAVAAKKRQNAPR